MGRTDVLAEVMLWLMTIGIVAAIGTVVWSAVLTTRARIKGGRVKENARARRIGWLTAGGTALLLLVTFLIASSASLNINGKPFTDTFWLRLADMFIISTAVLIVVAVVALIFSKLKIRK